MRDPIFYLDTNFFVYLFSKEQEEVKNLLKRLEHYKIFTSCLTYDEFVWAIRKLMGKEASFVAADFMLDLTNLKFFIVTKQTLMISKDAMIKFNLKPRDSLHYATMVKEEVMQIVSDDSDFDNVGDVKRIEVQAFCKKLSS